MIDWQLLGEYFPAYVDIDAELSGGNYRRDAAESTYRHDDQDDDKRRNTVRISTRLTIIPEDGGSTRVEKEVQPSRRRKKSVQETTPVTEHSTDHTTTDMQQLQDKQCDRRRLARAARVHQLWLDTVASCTYGGLCTHFNEPSDEHGTCMHSPVLSDRTFQNNHPDDAGRLVSRVTGRGIIPYAHRSRWKQQTISRRRKRDATQTQTSKKIQKTQVHAIRITRRTYNPSN